MSKYNFLFDFWGKNLIRHKIIDISLQDVSIPDESKSFLQDVGLPLIYSEYAKSFLPFTYLQSIEIENTFFYIIGDFSPGFMGTAFIGIKEGTNEVYRITRRRENKFGFDFMNEDLYRFVFFITHYNIFHKKYRHQPKNAYEMKQDYAKLKEILYVEDSLAMSNFDFYWRNTIEYVEVEYGDYLLE